MMRVVPLLERGPMPFPSTALLLCVYRDNQPVFAANFDGPVELGRQASDDETLFSVHRVADDQPYRVALIDREDTRVSRRHMRCEPLDGGRVRLTNCSSSIPVRLGSGSTLSVGAFRELPYPVELVIGPLTLRLDAPRQESLLGLLPNATVTPGLLAVAPSRLSTLSPFRNAN